MKDPQSGPSIEVSEERAIEELEEIPVEEKIREDLRCTPTLHAKYRSLLGRINGLQSRKQFPVLLQVFQMCFKGSFSNHWWCESSSQGGETTQVAASETSVLATHRTLDNNWVSWCLLPKQWWWIFSERHDSIFGRISRGMSYGSLVDYESQKIKRTVLSRNVAELYSFVKCCGSCQFLRGLWIDMSGDGCRSSHEEWREEPGDNSKNNSLTWANGNNSNDFHVAKGSLFREYSWSCSHSNSQFVGRLLNEVIGESRQSDHSSENWEMFGSGCSSKLQGTHGAQGLLIKRVQNIHAHKGETCFPLWTV